jgi:hypothetical protein
MKKTTLTTLFFVSLSCLFSQNLILNGSFQEQNTCKEFNALCAPVAWKTLNLEADTYLRCVGRDGTGSVVILQKADFIDYRVYIKTRLLCPLVKDSLYDISFYTKSKAITFPVLGFLFTYKEVFSSTNLPIEATPNHIFSINDCNINKRELNGWAKCSYQYKAIGNEAYLTIGNFTKDSDILEGWMQKNHTKVVAVEIDDVAITPISKTMGLCSNMNTVKEEIISDNERHTNYDVILQRISQKEAQLKNSEFNPNIGLKRVSSPCAGDDWINDYEIDTFNIPNRLFEFDNNWSYLKSDLDTVWETKRDSCIGITLLVTTSDEKDVQTEILLQKAHDLSNFLAKNLHVKQSSICIKKRVV